MQKILKDKSCGVIPFYQQSGNLVFLLVRHNLGHWSFPKGHPEKEETERQTALRELREETGVTDIELLKKFFVEKYTYEKDGIQIHKTVKFFLGKAKSKKVTILDKELCDIGWYDYDSALSLLTHPETKAMFRRVDSYLVKVKKSGHLPKS